MWKYVCLCFYLCFYLVYCQYGYQSYSGNRYNNYDNNYQNYPESNYQGNYGYQNGRTVGRKLFHLLPQTIRTAVINRWASGYSNNQYQNYQNGYNYQNPNYQSENYQYPNYENPNSIPNYQNSNYNNQNPNFNNQNPNFHLNYQDSNFNNKEQIPNDQNMNFNNQDPNLNLNYQDSNFNNGQPISNNQNINFNNQDPNFNNPDSNVNNQEPTPNNQNTNFNNQDSNFNNQEQTPNNQNTNFNNPDSNFSNQEQTPNNQNTNFNNPDSNFNNQEPTSNNQNTNFNNDNSNFNNQYPNNPNFNNEDPNFDVRLPEFTTPQGNLLNPVKQEKEEPFIFPDDDGGSQGKEGSVNIGDDVVHVVDTADEQVTPSTQPTEMVQGGLIRVTPSFENRNMFFNFNSESCQTVDNTPGQCITLLQCPEYLSLLKQGQNPTIVNILRRAHCGFDGTTPKVCCPPRGFETGPPIPATPPVTSAPVTSAPVTDRPARPKNNDEAYVDDLPNPPFCGVSNGAFPRIVRGVPAKLGQFPWMAILGYRGRRDPNTPRWLCGGSLISSKHVLTAAHCIHGRENDLYQVRLGELDLASETEGATPIDVPIIRKIKHEQYSPTAFSNDIGILVLDRIVKFTDLIRPICMPRVPTLKSNTFERYTPFIAGWGDTEFRGPSATHLQMTQLPVVTNEKCAKAYSAYKNQVIDHRVLCAGYAEGGRDACQGDSGGPLMQPIFNGTYNNFYQIGVVSYGKKCAEPGYPGVYSRITYFVPWIEEKVIGRSRK